MGASKPTCGKPSVESERMTDPKTYEIETIADIFEKVPEDRIDDFMEALRGMFEYYHRLNDCLDAIAKEEVKTNLRAFRWTDDGERKLTINFAESPNT